MKGVAVHDAAKAAPDSEASNPVKAGSFIEGSKESLSCWNQDHRCHRKVISDLNRRVSKS